MPVITYRGKEIVNELLLLRKYYNWRNGMCVYDNLCLTLSLGHKLLSSYWCFPWKIDIEFVLRTLRNVRNIKVPFFSSCTHFTVFSWAIHAAQWVWCTLCFNLKTFPGWVLVAKKLQVEKCCGHHTLRKLDFSLFRLLQKIYFLL